MFHSISCIIKTSYDTKKGYQMTKQNVKLIKVPNENGLEELRIQAADVIIIHNQDLIENGTIGARVHISEIGENLGITPESLNLQFEDSWADSNSTIYVDTTNTIELKDTLLANSTISNIALNDVDLVNARFQYLPDPNPKKLKPYPTLTDIYAENTAFVISNTPDLTPDNVKIDHSRFYATSMNIHDQLPDQNIQIDHLDITNTRFDVATSKLNLNGTTIRMSNLDIGQSDKVNIKRSNLNNITCKSDKMTDKNQSLYISNALLDNIIFENTITIEDTEIEVNEENLSTFDNVHLTNVFVIAPSTRMDITNSEIVDDVPIPKNQPVITINEGVMTTGVSTPTITQEIEQHTVPTNDQIIELDM